jgi:phytoene dehydrogenase-like protein
MKLGAQGCLEVLMARAVAKVGKLRLKEILGLRFRLRTGLPGPKAVNNGSDKRKFVPHSYGSLLRPIARLTGLDGIIPAQYYTSTISLIGTAQYPRRGFERAETKPIGREINKEMLAKGNLVPGHPASLNNPFTVTTIELDYGLSPNGGSHASHPCSLAQWLYLNYSGRNPVKLARDSFSPFRRYRPSRGDLIDQVWAFSWPYIHSINPISPFMSHSSMQENIPSADPRPEEVEARSKVGQEAGQFDVTVIGSGIGAMSFASIAARLSNQRVLLLERNEKPGGLTHEFQRPPGYQWDVGLHYVGQMGYDQMGRRLMDFLTQGRLDWRPLPDPFEVFQYPDWSFTVPFEQSAYQRKLQGQFPEESEAIEGYFKDLVKAAAWMSFHMARKVLPGWLHFLSGAFKGYGKHLALMRTREYMERQFADPKLRALLTSQWMDLGLPPGQSAFGIHALVVSSYLQGAYYPSGGAEKIAQHILPAIEEAGGRCRTQQEVRQILTEGQKATGVETTYTDENGNKQTAYYYAPVVVSDIGAETTFLHLLPESVDLPWREQIRNFPYGLSAVVLYLGLKETPATIGVRGENHWLFTGYDHDEMMNQAGETLEGNPPYAFLSFPSMKDPEAIYHTAEVMLLMDYEAFRKAIGDRGLENAEVYHAAKDKIASGLLDLVEAKLPGFKALVEYQEVATPFTMEHFTGRPLGSIYGVPAVPERYSQPWMEIETPVQGLYLTGSDVASMGVMGAAMGGVLTYGKVHGMQAFRKAWDLIKEKPSK